MRQKRETPEPWASAMERAEIRSLRQLSERTGVAVETLARLVHGEGVSSDHTLRAVAEVFRPADARRVAEWAGKQWGVAEPVLPDAARRLTPKQWEAVEAVINAMAEPAAGGREKDVISQSRDERPLRLAAQKRGAATPSGKANDRARKK